MRDVQALQPARADGLVSYQEGSVVSKTLVAKETGTVTLFAFAEGQGLSEHTAPYDAILYALDGEATVIVSGESVHLRNGEIVTLPADEPHSVEASTDFKMMLVMIRS